MTWRRLARLYPLAFALHPPLSLYAANAGHYSPSALAAPVVVSLVFGAVALAVARCTTRDPDLVAIRGFLLLLCFFTAGHLRSSVAEQAEVSLLGLPWPLRHVVDLAFGLGALLSLRVTPRKREAVGNAFAACSLVLLAMTLGPLLWARATGVPSTPGQQEGRAERGSAPEGAPHIFHLVLDGYARDDVLRETYGHDNGDFLRGLERRGFTVASRARANYCQTALSIASSLNMQYVDGLVPAATAGGSDRAPLTRVIRENRVMAELQRHGYTTVAFATGYGAAEVRSADRFVDPGRGLASDPFFRGFLENTPIPPVRRVALEAARLAGGGDPSEAAPGAWRELHRRQVLAVLEGVARFAAERRPVFVFAHVLAPHPPFVFDREGGLPDHARHGPEVFLSDGDHWRRRSGLDAATYRRRYVDQLVYVNRRVLGIVDEILAEAARPVVILIQADHGPGSSLNWEDPRQSDLRERLAILSAFRFPPGLDAGDVDPGLTPVNTFRIVLSAVLGLDLPRLPDRSLFSTWTEPYATMPLEELADGSLRVEPRAERAGEPAVP